MSGVIKLMVETFQTNKMKSKSPYELILAIDVRRGLIISVATVWDIAPVLSVVATVPDNTLQGKCQLVCTYYSF